MTGFTRLVSGMQSYALVISAIRPDWWNMSQAEVWRLGANAVYHTHLTPYSSASALSAKKTALETPRLNRKPPMTRGVYRLLPLCTSDRTTTHPYRKWLAGRPDNGFQSPSVVIQQTCRAKCMNNLQNRRCVGKSSRPTITLLQWSWSLPQTSTLQIQSYGGFSIQLAIMHAHEPCAGGLGHCCSACWKPRWLGGTQCLDICWRWFAMPRS